MVLCAVRDACLFCLLNSAVSESLGPNYSLNFGLIKISPCRGKSYQISVFLCYQISARRAVGSSEQGQRQDRCREGFLNMGHPFKSEPLPGFLLLFCRRIDKRFAQ